MAEDDKPGFDIKTGGNVLSPGMGNILSGEMPTLESLTDPLGLFRAPELQWEGQVPEMDLEAANQIRAQQGGLTGMLQAGAAGEGPTAAQNLMAQGMGQAQAAAASQAASARGANAAMAQRAAAQQAAGATADIAGKAAQLRAAEQQAAQRQLGQHLGGMRGQDIDIASARAQHQLTAQGQQLQGAVSQQAAAQQAQGGVLGAAGGIVGGILSDVRAKENVRPVMPDVQRSQDALGPIQPYDFQYTPEAADRIGADTSQRRGVMAQDLAQSPTYQHAVVPTNEGLALDPDRLMQANTAEIGGIDKRLKALEGGGNASTMQSLGMLLGQMFKEREMKEGLTQQLGDRSQGLEDMLQRSPIPDFNRGPGAAPVRSNSPAGFSRGRK